jgi:hypothetical protein
MYNSENICELRSHGKSKGCPPDLGNQASISYAIQLTSKRANFLQLESRQHKSDSISIPICLCFQRPHYCSSISC